MFEYVIFGMYKELVCLMLVMFRLDSNFYKVRFFDIDNFFILIIVKFM